MSNGSDIPTSHIMNHPSESYWRPVPIQPPVPSDPRVVNQFHSYETDDSDSDMPRSYGVIYSNTNSPESSTPEVSPRATPEISSAIRMQMIAHTSRSIPSVQNYNVNGMNYTDGIDDQNNGTREISEIDALNNEINSGSVQHQQDQPDEPLNLYLAALRVLRQRVRELDSDSWMFANNT